MSHASPDDVRRLAALARVEVPESELARFASEFDGVLAYVGKLDELTLEKRDRQLSPVRNVFRDDTHPHASGTHTEKIAEQFPGREGNSLSVKQIITHD